MALSGEDRKWAEELAREIALLSPLPPGGGWLAGTKSTWCMCR